MKTTFEKPNANAAEKPAIEVKSEQVPTPAEGVTVESKTTIAAPATPAPAAPSAPMPVAKQSSPTALVFGDKLPNFSDIILPRLNIAQFIGELKDSFAPGSIVFNQSTLLFAPPDIDKATGMAKAGSKIYPPVKLTIVGFMPTRYVEKVEGGRGMIVKTEEEVRANGGTLDYNEWKLKKSAGMKRFEQLAEAVILVERPDHIADDDTVFVHEADGRKFALGLWGMKGTSYTHAAKRVFFTARSLGCLKAGGYPSFNYAVTTRLEEFAGNSFFVPVCVPIGKNTPAFLEFVKGIVEAPSQPADAATE